MVQEWKEKEECCYKDFLPRVERWTFWYEDERVIDFEWDPLLVGYVAFVINYVVAVLLVKLWK